MAATLSGATWAPVANRPGNGTFSDARGIADKITLMTTGTFAVPSWVDPPHFSLDLRSGGKMYQHIAEDVPAYALNGGTVSGLGYRSASRDAGKNIQVAVIGYSQEIPSPVLGRWSKEHYKILAWWLNLIMAKNNIPVLAGWNFSAKPVNLGASRMTWAQFSETAGVLGKEHAPFNTADWSPGIINTKTLIDYIRATDVPRPTQLPVLTAERGIAESAQSRIAAPPGSAMAAGAGGAALMSYADTGAGLAGSLLGLAVNNLAPGVSNSPTSSTFRASPMMGLPFRFNPPLHPINLPKRVDFTSSNPTPAMDRYLDERTLAAGEKDPANLKHLRLGRIIQHENAAGMAALNKERYGFRFLYNPTTVAIATSRNDTMILDPQTAVGSVISGINQNFQTIAFTLVLNRAHDVISPGVSAGDYQPGISEEDMAGIKKYGTHWDMEILYRACNGVFELEDRGRTSDIGLVLPSNLRLLLGPGQNHFGFIHSINYHDQMFSRDMVPIQTEVTILFRRHVDMAPEDLGTLLDPIGANDASRSYAAATHQRVNLVLQSDVLNLVSLIQGGAGGLLSAGLKVLLKTITGGGDNGDGGSVIGPPSPVPTDGSGPVGNNSNAPLGSDRLNRVTTGYYGYSGHNGWDYGNATLGDPIYATRDGVISKIKVMETSFGHHIVIQSGGVEHYYCHQSRFVGGLMVGQKVAAGQHIGYVGTTGNSTGYHLHYAEKENGSWRIPKFAINLGKNP